MRAQMLRLTIVVAASALAAVAVSAEPERQPAQAPAQTHVKTIEQIRCELFHDTRDGQAACGATRAWITRTGETVTEPTRIRSEVVRLTQARRPRNQVGRQQIIPVSSSDLFINFAMNSSDVSDDAFEQAKNLYEAVKGIGSGWNQYRFEVVGHTDAVGSAPYNQELSVRRAQVVADLLVQRGVARANLEVKGYGFRRPIEGLSRTDGINRRVEIKRLD